MPFTPEDNLRLAIRYGLVKGLRLVRGLRQQLGEDDRNCVAEAIREHLTLAGWHIEPGLGIGGHSQLAGTVKSAIAPERGGWHAPPWPQPRGGKAEAHQVAPWSYPDTRRAPCNIAN
jgi:hypothetical protein